MSRHPEVLRKLREEGAPLGLRTLIEICRDPDAPKGVRADCAKALLDRAGYVAPRAEPVTPDEKMLVEMSQAELLEVISTCEAELAGRAKVVQSDDALHLTARNSLTRPAGQ
jgi:hypothetical protein